MPKSQKWRKPMARRERNFQKRRSAQLTAAAYRSKYVEGGNPNQNRLDRYIRMLRYEQPY